MFSVATFGSAGHLFGDLTGAHPASGVPRPWPPPRASGRPGERQCTRRTTPTSGASERSGSYLPWCSSVSFRSSVRAPTSRVLNPRPGAAS